MRTGPRHEPGADHGGQSYLMPSTPTTLDRGHRRLILVACSFSVFMVTLDATIVNVALPTIQWDLGASYSGLQWVVDAYVLVLASLLISSGAAGDRHGRRRVFQTGLVIFTLGSLMCSLAPSLVALIAFRSFQAIGASMLVPTTLAVVTNLQQVRGYSAVLAGLATLPTTGMIMFISPASGRLTGRRGPRLPVVLAGLLFLSGLLVLVHTTPTVSLGLLFAGYVLIGLGMGLINPPITNAAVAGMPPDQAGVASAVAGTSRQIGGVLGVALLGAVVETHFLSALPTKLAPLHLSAAVETHVLATAHNGLDAASSVGGNGGTDIQQAVRSAFTDGIHWGYAVAVVAAALVVVIGSVAMSRRQAAYRGWRVWRPPLQMVPLLPR